MKLGDVSESTVPCGDDGDECHVTRFVTHWPAHEREIQVIGRLFGVWRVLLFARPTRRNFSFLSFFVAGPVYHPVIDAEDTCHFRSFARSSEIPFLTQIKRTKQTVCSTTV